MKRTILEQGTATTSEGYTLRVKGLSEDLDVGEASVANRGAVDLRIEGPDGFVLDLHLPGDQAEELVRPLVAGAVEHETEADIARRYLRDHAGTMYPHQIESLKKMAGLPYDQEVLDAVWAQIHE